MFLKTLQLKNFRNYEDIKLEFDKNTVLIIGDNGLGKTNLLEAIHYISAGKSHRTASQDDMIRWGSDFSLIRALTSSRKNSKSGGPENGYYENLIELQLDPGSRIKIRLNRAVCKKKSEFISILPTVIFSPDDLSLIKGGPSLRRAWLDDLLEKIYHDYYALCIKYQKILNQRNSLIKTLSNQKNRINNSTMEAWNENLVKYGSEIIYRRICIIDEVKKHFPYIFGRFFKNHNASLFYVFSWERKTSDYLPLVNSNNPEEKTANFKANDENEYKSYSAANETASGTILKDVNNISSIFREKLKENFDRELAFKNTLTGPHRDDLIITLNDKTLKSFGSQGQQRIGAVCLKFCELEIIKEKLCRDPLLLLDDVLSELDRERENQVLNIIGNRFQTFITTSNVNYVNDVQGIENAGLQKLVVRDNKIFQVNDIYS